MAELTPGLYDRLVDEWLQGQLPKLEARRLRASVEEVDAAEIPARVGEVVGEWVRSVLAGVGESDRLEAAVALTEAVLARLAEHGPDSLQPGSRLIDPVARLVAVEALSPTNVAIPIRRPLTPLRDTVLMTNSRGQPSVGTELAAEIESADGIDLVLAFIRWTGICEPGAVSSPCCGREVVAGHHDDLHGKHGAASVAGARGSGRGGQGLL